MRMHECIIWREEIFNRRNIDRSSTPVKIGVQTEPVFGKKGRGGMHDEEKPEINSAVGCGPMARVMAEKTICIERWLAATDERASGRFTLQENASLFECFPYVCPEPVMVK